jgi:hypothetical protein
MPINRLYPSLRDLLVLLRPTERQTRLRNFSWLLAGLFLSRSVHLSKIAKERFWAMSGALCPMGQRGFRWSATANS